MSKAAQLVSRLMEEGPDDLNPKQAVMNLPDPVPEVFFGDPEEKDSPDFGWRYDLAAQLNRLTGLAQRLERSGQAESAKDLFDVIERVAEFESVGKVQQ